MSLLRPQSQLVVSGTPERSVQAVATKLHRVLVASKPVQAQLHLTRPLSSRVASTASRSTSLPSASTPENNDRAVGNNGKSKALSNGIAPEIESHLEGTRVGETDNGAPGTSQSEGMAHKPRGRVSTTSPVADALAQLLEASSKQGLEGVARKDTRARSVKNVAVALAGLRAEAEAAGIRVAGGANGSPEDIAKETLRAWQNDAKTEQPPDKYLRTASGKVLPVRKGSGGSQKEQAQLEAAPWGNSFFAPNSNAKAVLESEEGALAKAAAVTSKAVAAGEIAPAAAAQLKESLPFEPLTEPAGQPLKINLELNLYKAKRLQQKRRNVLAEQLLRKCIEEFPEDGRPYVQLGKILERRGDLDEARQLYEQGVSAVGGDNPYIWQSWAMLEVRSGNLNKARRYLDAATVADKQHAAAWHAWGMLEKREGNLKKARNLFEKGILRCPDSGYLYQSLAIMEEEAGRYESAQTYFSKGVKANPKSAALWQAWALMEAKQGQSETARRLFQRALEASPKNGPTYLAWALFEAKNSQKDRARELLTQGLSCNQRDPMLLQAFARFEYDCGNVDGARVLFRRATLVDTRHQPTWQAWAVMEWKEKDIQRARELFQRGVWANPKSTSNVARVFQAWGVLEDREGNIGVARELFKCALKADNSSEPAWMAWAQLEERVGNIYRAEELRQLCYQQMTQVVEPEPLSDLVGPMLGKIKDWFKRTDSKELLGEVSLDNVLVEGKDS